LAWWLKGRHHTALTQTEQMLVITRWRIAHESTHVCQMGTVCVSNGDGLCVKWGLCQMGTVCF